MQTPLNRTPAILGGPPAFAEQVPVARPTVPDGSALSSSVTEILRSGMLTNSCHVQAFEADIASYLGVEHVVAVSSCTTGIILLLRCSGVRGSVVVPSFTFMAAAHAADWNRLDVELADSDLRTWTVDPDSVTATLTASAGAVLAVHTYGAPCDVAALQAIADRRGIPLLLDAAHGFGAGYGDGQMVGTKGMAEVFSLSPTKPLSTGEGGLITTNDGALARELRIGREYGNPGDYNSRFIGLNGRMTEFAALLGRTALAEFPEWMQRRRTLAQRYARNLAHVPGVQFQQMRHGAVSSVKDLSIRVRPADFGLDRDCLAKCLAAEGISTRSYFNPPVHRQTAYRKVQPRAPLPATEELSATMLTLPLYSHMPTGVVDRICESLQRIHAAADLVAETTAAVSTSRRAS